MMTYSSCPRTVEILEAATDPQRLPLGADAVSHLRTCLSCRDIAEDALLVELLTRAEPGALPAQVETATLETLGKSRPVVHGARGWRAAAAVLVLAAAYVAGRWTAPGPSSGSPPPQSKLEVVPWNSERPGGLFSRHLVVIEPTPSPRGFLAALKPK